MTTIEKPKKSWPRRAARKTIIALAILAPALLLAWTVWGYVEAWRVTAEIARIQAAREPLTFRELDAARPEVDEADDAGPFYEAALALIRQDAANSWKALSDLREELRQSPSSRPSGETAGTVRSLLAENALALEMLDRGAHLPGCTFDVGADRGAKYSMQRLRRARSVAKLLSGQALILAAEGRADAAVDSLVCLLQFRRAFDSRPFLLSSLVGIACNSLAFEDTGVLLALGQPSEAALVRLAAALQAADDPKALEQTYLGERVYALQFMQEIITGAGSISISGEPEPMASEKLPSGGFWGRPIMQRMAIGYLRKSAEFVSIARKPFPEALQAVKDRPKTGSSWADLLAPALGNAIQHAATSVAQGRCAWLAIQIERFRRAHGKLPGSLAELASQFAASMPDYSAGLLSSSLPAPLASGPTGRLPSDPFTGQNLLYRVEDGGFVVYSPGPDGQDDGGGVIRFEGGQRPPDVGLRVRLASSRPGL